MAGVTNEPVVPMCHGGTQGSHLADGCHPRELTALSRARDSHFLTATAVPQRLMERCLPRTQWTKQAPCGAEGAGPGPSPARAPHEPHPEWAGARRGNVAPQGRDPGAAGSGALPC